MQFLQKILKPMAKGLNNMAKNDIVKNTANFEVPTDFINTFDLDTNDGKMKLVNAINNSVALKDYMDTELHIVDCVTMPGTRKGRNGMPDSTCKNTHIIDENGVSYFSQSDGVARSVQMFAAIWPDFGKETTEQGYLAIKCVEQELANGNTLKTLVFVD